MISTPSGRSNTLPLILLLFRLSSDPLISSLLPVTCVSYYGLFLVLSDLYHVIPSCLYHAPLATRLALMVWTLHPACSTISSSLPLPFHHIHIASTSLPMCSPHFHTTPTSASYHFFFFFVGQGGGSATDPKVYSEREVVSQPHTEQTLKGGAPLSGTTCLLELSLPSPTGIWFKTPLPVGGTNTAPLMPAQGVRWSPITQMW